MKQFFETNDWDDEKDVIHFKSKPNLKHKIKKKKSKSKDNYETATPVLKNSPLLKNVSSIKKAKDLTTKISKLSKTVLTNNDDIVELPNPKLQTKIPLNQTQNKEYKKTEDAKKLEAKDIESACESNNTKFSDSKKTNFRDKLQETLKGGRFRFLNERLYTMKGNEAKQMFDQDSTAFASYHEGYRQQVEKWPFNPLNRMIKKIRKCPKEFVIADFGCGEARLAQSIKHKCVSIDLISVREDVIACDMAKTPLTASTIDVALYCLSLMGTNLNEFLLEANRVLKVGGFLYIAEIASRFDNDIKAFLLTVEKFGFKLLNKDLGNSFFYFFDFKKETNCNKYVMNEIELSLKPCIYKKR